MDERWPRLSEYLDRVIDLDGPERDAWIARLQSRDPEMAAHLLDILRFTTHEGFRDFLAGESPFSAAEMAQAPEATLIGRRVGPYVIEAEVGRGGMGSVWRARRADGRYEGVVAVKFIHAAWIGRAGEQRFKIEGSLLARLDHPHIARLIDAGMLDGTQPYLVLEYIEGEPIDAYCERHSLDLAARITIFLDMLSAVAHAHSHLVVHRDIKPGNILVASDGSLKLLDFGIAKLLHDESGGAAPTQSAGSVLTPLYAAPEQLMGKTVTTATDVYSLGLVLYVLLTGTHPMAAARESQAELISAVLTRDPPRASMVASVPQIRRRLLRGDLDNVLGKALKKAPTERYASVGAFADDLRRYLTHEPLQARPDTVAYRAAKFIRRHRGGVASAILITFALIGTTAFALWELYEARADRNIALSEVERAHANDLVMTVMVADVARDSPADAVRRRLDKAVQFIERRYRGQPTIAASALLVLQNFYLTIGDVNAAAELVTKAEVHMRGYDDPYINVGLACNAGRNLALSGDIPAATVRMGSALADMRKLRHVSPDLRYSCSTTAAMIAQASGDFSTAIANQQVVLKALADSGDTDSPDWVGANHDLARAYYMAGNFADAYRTESRVLAAVTSQGLTSTPQYFSLASVGCAALRAGGQPARSLEFVSRIVSDAQPDGKDIDVPYYIDACRDLSALAAGVNGDIESRMNASLRSAEASNMMSIATGLRVALTTLAINRNDIETAQSRWNALSVSEARMLKDQQRGIEVVRLLLLHARMDLLREHPVGALSVLGRAEDLISARNQPMNPDSREVELLMSQAYLTMRDAARAAAHADAAITLARQTAVDSHSSAWIGEALLWRARAEQASGDSSKASATARQALPHLERNLDPDSALLAAARALASAG